MISYGNPICPVTHNRANLFCCEANCSLPAFACMNECLLEEGHTDHKTLLWSAIEEEVRQAIELPLTKEQLMLMEKQEKQLKIAIEELKTIQANHEKSLIQTKKRLSLKDDAMKVLQAIQSKSTNQLTGNNMFCLIESIQRGTLFKNPQKVKRATDQRNGLVSQLSLKLNTIIEGYKTQQMKLPKPERIPNFDKTIFTLDNKNSDVLVRNGFIIPKQGSSGYRPAYAREQLIAGESCEVEISGYGQGDFMIGVAPANLIDRYLGSSNQCFNNQSMCIWAFKSVLYSKGNEQKYNFKLKTGDIVEIRHATQQIEWWRGGQMLCAEPINKYISDVPIFPVIWVRHGKIPHGLRFV